MCYQIHKDALSYLFKEENYPEKAYIMLLDSPDLSDNSKHVDNVWKPVKLNLALKFHIDSWQIV